MRLTPEREKEIRHELEMENGHGPVKELLSEIDALRLKLDEVQYPEKAYVDIVFGDRLKKSIYRKDTK